MWQHVTWTWTWTWMLGRGYMSMKHGHAHECMWMWHVCTLCDPTHPTGYRYAIRSSRAPKIPTCARSPSSPSMRSASDSRQVALASSLQSARRPAWKLAWRLARQHARRLERHRARRLARHPVRRLTQCSSTRPLHPHDPLPPPSPLFSARLPARPRQIPPAGISRVRRITSS